MELIHMVILGIVLVEGIVFGYWMRLQWQLQYLRGQSDGLDIAIEMTEKAIYSGSR